MSSSQIPGGHAASAARRALLIDVVRWLRRQEALGLSFVPGAAPPAAPAVPAPLPTSSPPLRPAVVAAAAASAPALGEGQATSARPSLAEVAAALGNCQRCKLATHRTHIVFGTGAADARLMFVGEGPGQQEDRQGEPFVGPAGQLLDRMILAMGERRAGVYIANIVKCRPPANRDPEADEVAACEPFLRQQIDAVQPQVLVVLGRVACQTLLRDRTPISRQRGHWRQYAGIATMPTFHPAYLLRNPGQKRLVWQDLQLVMQRLVDLARG